MLTGVAKEARMSLRTAGRKEEEENLNLEGQLYSTSIAD